jgi:hypothetical protein
MQNGPNASRRRALVSAGIIVVLGALGWYLAQLLSQSARMQDCLLSGRRNCVPLETTR